MDNLDARKLYVARRYNYYRPLINTYRVNKYIHMISFFMHLIVPIAGYIFFRNPITFLAVIPIIIPTFQMIRYNRKLKQQYVKVLDGMMSKEEMKEMIKSGEIYDYLEYIFIQERRIKEIQTKDFVYKLDEKKRKPYNPVNIVINIKKEIKKRFDR